MKRESKIRRAWLSSQWINTIGSSSGPSNREVEHSFRSYFRERESTFLLMNLLQVYLQRRSEKTHGSIKRMLSLKRKV